MMKQLSPSKLTTFLDCPCKFKYKYIDRLPDPAGAAAERGLMVHDALELLFDLPAQERTLVRALGCVDMVSAGWPNVDKIEAERLVRNLYALEDPTTVNVLHTEMDVQLLDGEREWRGIFDRFDSHGDELLIVDYKTGKVPADKDLSAKTLGIKFYGLLASKLGYTPKRLILLYLGTPARLELPYNDAVGRAISNKAIGAWDSIDACEASGNWKAKPSFACKFCPFLEFCEEGQKSVDKAKQKK